jgi:dihydrofolate reductase
MFCMIADLLYEHGNNAKRPHVVPVWREISILLPGIRTKPTPMPELALRRSIDNSMRRIVYYVAASIDGFISGPEEDISGFVGQGNGVEKYLWDLNAYDTVIMGRNTYEFGYKFGLQPGQPAYPHMTHYIFSNRLTFDQPSEKVHVKRIDLNEIQSIREQPGTDIYLCGGGKFAGWLLERQQIDMLKIKLNPLILGRGVRLFEGEAPLGSGVRMELIDSELYDHGLQIMSYRLHYA